MSDNNIRDQILECLKNSTSKLIWEKRESWDNEDLVEFTAGYLCERLGCSRNLISHYMSEFHGEGIVLKVNSRPVYFFLVKELCEKFHTNVSMHTFDTIEELVEELSRNANRSSAFLHLVGAYESLSYVVEQCKAAITYPNNGLPLLLQGPTGTGKSLIAQLMYDYGVEKGIIDKDARFVTVNCAEYTNNPEMLMTNLFGYKKGAYTGADKDTKGLIAMADGGVLFMDEVHGLKPECQEKIFLFMDKGIYHMVGDNDTWHKAKVRLLFATTENPDTVLLKTLLRRIPIMVKVPSLSERPLQEKKELLHYIIMKEKEQVGRDILISRLAYQTLESHQYSGNIGELKNCIRASVAKAFLRIGETKPEKEIEIHIFDLPSDLLTMPQSDLSDDEYDDRTLLNTAQILANAHSESRLFLLNQQLIRQFSTMQNKDVEFEEFTSSCCLRLEPYVDYLFLDDNGLNSPKYKLVNTLMSNILNIIVHKYHMEKFSNNEISILSKFVVDYMQNFTFRSNLRKTYRREASQFSELVRNHYPTESNIINDIWQLLEDSLDFDPGFFGYLDMLLFFRYFNREMSNASIPVVIIAHGYSIASGIAEVANQLLKQKIFDAIDMPIESDFEIIVKKLSEYLKRMEGCKEIIVMVDMGSLEDIHNYLENIINMDIGIINNVTTKLALDIGSMIMEGCPIHQILEEASDRNKHSYLIVKNRKKQDAILSVCETGIGTAQKISDLIGHSLPESVSISMIPYDYENLRKQGLGSSVFDKYNVLFIVGTRDPKIASIPFISIEEMIEQQSSEKTNVVFANHMKEDEIKQFNQNMIKNFSLDNLLDYLTILDSEKIIDSVEEIIKKIQKGLQVTLSSGVSLGLYIHISCLIERLIIDKYITKFDHLEEFERDHQDFIHIVKDAFKDVEQCYNVDIPVSEIGYIYEYIYNRDKNSVKEMSNSVNDLWEKMGFTS